MKLTSVTIKNFRSIKDAKLDFVPSCRALIGINESGKTNVLHALSMLSDDISPSADDIREPLQDEDPIDEAYVRFVFRLSTADKVTITKSVCKSVLAHDLSHPIFKDADTTLTEFINGVSEGLYAIDLIDQEKKPQYWRMREREVADGWLRPKPGLPDTITISTDDGPVPLSLFKIVSSDYLTPDLRSSCQSLQFTQLAGTVGSAIADFVENSLPDCFLWTYSESQLLPPSVSMRDFAASPSSYEPLRQMFSLAGHSDIAATLSEAQSKKNGVRNLLRRVSRAATKHMRSVWRDYKGIEINVEPNGEQIEINIKDTYNLYDFSRRSDGFKRFITFLFLVSARTATGSLRNVLYLQDEPDIGLHPSGARHLLSELIRVAKNNYVVFSTHSIFMIDRNRIERHYIVSKDKEVTTLSVADASNFRDEEVLYNALEFSAFQLLQEHNILFEGWKDKRLFEIAISGRTEAAKSMARKASGIGFCHAQGVKDIPKVSSLLEMARRNWIVISDGDKPAIQRQKEYSWDGKWHRYDELHPDSDVVTAEDFFNAKKARSVLSKVCKRHSIDLPREFIIPDSDRLSSFKSQLMRASTAEEDVRAIISDFKDELIESGKPADLRDIYFQVMGNALQEVSNCRADGVAST